MSKKAKKIQKTKKSDDAAIQNDNTQSIVALSALPISHEFSCVIMRCHAVEEEKKKEIDRICQLMQNAIYRLDMISTSDGTVVSIDAYNLEDTISGKLLWNLVPSLIDADGKCYMEVYNFSGNDLVALERYMLDEVSINLTRDKRSNAKQSIRIEARILQEIDDAIL
ncbi:MAG: hypothetical protein GF411_13830 [Candidatus Lokiarchaeota archaeon]|nr:hypothetical protein [Candidatus Lokiarchaeota archaeon]